MEAETLKLILQFGLPLVGLVALVSWVKSELKEQKESATLAKNACESERRDLQTKLIETHQSAREVITKALVDNTQTNDKLADSVAKLAENQKEFTETLSRVKCAYQSGHNQAVR